MRNKVKIKAQFKIKKQKGKIKHNNYVLDIEQ